MPKEINGKFFLVPGDTVTVRDATLEFKGGESNYVLDDLSDATITWYDEKAETDYEITYAWDLPKSDPNYGKPYFEK